ncbi:MAG: glutathione S-transferase family protein [Acidisphaera sp.]|nr:glutathione S-transferase family protein [Acidisphaera sp.]
MLQLFGHPFSSYTWKALIPLYAHAVPFVSRVLGPDHPDNASVVQQRTPAGKFPLLLDGDDAVFEATGIIEYLVATRPECRPLLPAEPIEAARMRMLDRVFDNYVMGNMMRVVASHLAAPEAPDQREIGAARQALARAYRWLETWLTAEGEPQGVTLLTAAAAPSLFYADWVLPIAAEGCTRLAAWRGSLLGLPPVARCVEEARPFRHLFPPGAPDRD